VILDLLDIFFVTMIVIIFGFVIHLETQVKMIRTMMEEHIKFDDKICDLQKNQKTH